MDGELPRFGAQLFVLGPRHADPPDAVRVAALADEVERLLLQLEPLCEVLDPLVDLTEDGLVQPDTFLARAHEALNALIAAIALEEGVPLLPFHDTLEDPDRPGRMREEWTSDGDHPSVAGYRRLGELAFRLP